MNLKKYLDEEKIIEDNVVIYKNPTKEEIFYASIKYGIRFLLVNSTKSLYVTNAGIIHRRMIDLLNLSTKDEPMPHALDPNLFGGHGEATKDGKIRITGSDGIGWVGPIASKNKLENSWSWANKWFDKPVKVWIQEYLKKF